MLDKERPLCRRQRASRCWWRGAARHDPSENARPALERPASLKVGYTWRESETRMGFGDLDPAVTVTVTNSRTSKVERGRQGEHRADVSPRASEPGRGRGAFSREVMGREGAKLCETGGEVDVTSVLGAIEIERTRSRPPRPFR